MTVPERLAALRAEMKARNIDMYIVPTADFHESEYVGEHFKARRFITGFTGSAGTAVITMDDAGLWTDGRYFVQAAAQLAGSTVRLFKMGEEGVPTVAQFVEQTLKSGGVIGFDGRVVNGALGRTFRRIAEKKNGSLHVTEDLVGLIWADRPPLSREPVMIFDTQYVGKPVSEKLADVRKVMAEKGADLHLLTSLYDIAWLLNVRGGDISYVPVVLSYLALTQDRCLWFLQEEIVTPELRAYLDANNIETRPYDSFYAYVEAIGEDKAVLMDTTIVNYRACAALKAKVIDAQDPTVLMKSIKNPVEMENTRKAHLVDAVAMCRFMYWLKTNVGKIPMTELSAGQYLDGLRAQQPGFLDLSFDTICAYAHHGAIVHYAATGETSIDLRPEGLLLVDSGGHYLQGTTDITRTFALGPVTDEMKKDFTVVCKSMLNLMSAKFLYGCTGLNLDILARGPLWDRELDYKHGTGHGVGYVLNVHEGPNGFRWKAVPERVDGSRLEEGMVTTDEPGLYIEGSHGVRTENELLCRKGVKNEFGQFMYFENLTFVPIDLDAIDETLLNETDKQRLNDYHKAVYETVAPMLTAEEAEWLKEYTRAI